MQKMGGKRVAILPDGSELHRRLSLPKSQRPTLQAIADQYGVSREAVRKRRNKWLKQQLEQSKQPHGPSSNPNGNDERRENEK